MTFSLRFLRMPRPTHFLGLFDLQNGAELILMSALLNKVSGLYGILAIFTGAAISGLQLSMYIYSILLAILLVILTPKLHHRDPLAALSFAYLYLFDSLINALYTVVFGISWFLVLSAKHPLSSAAKTIDETAGFTSPVYNVTNVEVIQSGQEAVAVGMNVDGAAQQPYLGAGMLQPESPTCVLIIAILWVVRAYFVVIVAAFARSVVMESATPGEAPFEGRNYGEGWKGQLGRALVKVGRSYWIGKDGWVPLGGKFRRSRDERRPSIGQV